MIEKLSILIPCYNEEATIQEIISRVIVSLKSNAQSGEVIIVDDCSTDNTLSLIKEFTKTQDDIVIKIIESDVNKGKGSAIRLGIPHLDGDYVIIQDADLEYDPDDYKDLLVPVLKANADVVYGSRFVGSKPHRVLLIWHYLGNRFLTFLSNILANLNLSDMEVGLKVFKVPILKQLNLKENGFGFEPEVTAKISKITGIKIYEVGISYYGRAYSEGKKITWKDGVKAIYYIFKYNLFSKS